ncbi:hypothetical protein RCL1_005418 [Eukaryota sp. TZLM3-RCL]
MPKSGIIRYLTIVIDASESSSGADFRPTRLSFIKICLEDFLPEFFNENPLSHVSLLLSKDGKCSRLTDFSASALSHISALEVLPVPNGTFSLQNSLDLAVHIHNTISPAYCSKEVLILTSSISSIDPADPLQTISQIQKQDPVRACSVSILSLAASVYLFEQCAEKCRGFFHVATLSTDFSINLKKLITPPPQLFSTSFLIPVGFPSKSEGVWYFPDISSIEPVLCEYECPRCSNRTNIVPGKCPFCKLQLTTSSHLISSSVKMDRLKTFVHLSELPANQSCRGCNCILNEGFGCVGCSFVYCKTCQSNLIEHLHLCPGCLLLPS